MKLSHQRNFLVVAAVIGVSTLWAASSAHFALSQTCDSQISEPNPPDDVVATVGDHKIHLQTAQRFLEKRITAQNLASNDLIKAYVLEHLVRRAIVRDFLEQKNWWAGENAVRLDIEQFETQLKRADQTLEDHLQKNKISRENFEFETAWRLSWDAYLKRILTDKVLADYFEQNRKQFDGTQIKVAQLLIKSDSQSDKNCLEQLISIKQKLEDQPLDWSKLVAQYSEAASKDSGGLVGWIGFDGPMPPDFTRETFKLDVGQISEPFKTKIGWHLIKCLEIKPGKLGPQDAREKVIASAKQELFFKISRDHFTNVKIEYSGKWPHLDESGKLAR